MRALYPLKSEIHCVKRNVGVTKIEVNISMRNSAILQL